MDKETTLQELVRRFIWLKRGCWVSLIMFIVSFGWGIFVEPRFYLISIAMMLLGTSELICLVHTSRQITNTQVEPESTFPHRFAVPQLAPDLPGGPRALMIAFELKKKYLKSPKLLFSLGIDHQEFFRRTSEALEPCCDEFTKTGKIPKDLKKVLRAIRTWSPYRDIKVEIITPD